LKTFGASLPKFCASKKCIFGARSAGTTCTPAREPPYLKNPSDSEALLWTVAHLASLLEAPESVPRTLLAFNSYSYSRASSDREFVIFRGQPPEKFNNFSKKDAKVPRFGGIQVKAPSKLSAKRHLPSPVGCQVRSLFRSARDGGQFIVGATIKI